MNKLPDEILTELQDKAKLFDRLARAYNNKRIVMAQPHTQAAGAVNLFTVEVNKIMSDAEQFGFIETQPVNS